MKRILLYIVFMLSFGAVKAQQQSLVTQYFNQVLSFNPAYAGVHKGAEVNASLRTQWLGLEGAPNVQLVNFHLPVMKRRVGLGVGVQRTSISINQELTADAYYAYHMKMKKGQLSLGVQASIRNYSADFSDPRIVTTQPRENDPSIPMGMASVTVPNFGFGAYYKSKYWFGGISSPRILNNNIDFAKDANLSRESLHAYGLLGFRIPVTHDLIISPMALMKYVSQSPVDLDLTLFFRFVDKIGFGLNYRSRNSVFSFEGESLSFIFNAALSPKIVLGMSYDMTLSELKDYTSGSAEFYAKYSFTQRKAKSKSEPKENN